ncbi:MAG TPA: serine/threonine protein kinase, partial [Verrucomicrobiae bacterium]|nr:serine/threonine protein kinase [Verrucomicrobiae bacterium]
MSQTNPSHSRTSSVASVLLFTRGFFKTQLWVWPLVAALVLGIIGVWLRVKMEGATKQQIAEMLQTILNANTEALHSWSGAMKADAENLADDDRVGEFIAGLIQQTKSGTQVQAALLTAPQLSALRAYLKPMIERRGFSGFVVLDTNFLVLASGHDSLVGLQSPAGYTEQFAASLTGKALVTRPFPSVALLPDGQGNLRVGVPTMFAIAPVLSTNGQIMAMLGLRIAPDTDFTRILATARAGKTGETYAFDRAGKQLSESRFDNDLKRLGLIPDTTEARSTLTLELRDPLVDLNQGRQSPQRRTELPLIHAISEALKGHTGVDANGYRDYRGVEVVGAWTWVDDFDMGLTTEMDRAEAFRALRILRGGFWFIFALLLIASVLVYVLMRVANRLQRAAWKAALKAKQLGQYALDDKIGEGEFGAVYRAHHALMRRPVAVKLLHTEKLDLASSVRFEREVQLTSQLTHPNTITIYDYGRTPEGIFYYAMEYLDGLTLNQLVKQYGAQPEGRVIAILRQVCGSLAEAHTIGLVHRDIKPANIFLTQRGGVADFVKVLDFGLVKSLDAEGVELTMGAATLGTPLYMSPEAVLHPNTVDARSDLYSVGAVGYFLVTGEPLFEWLTLGDVLLHQVKDLPMRPSERLGKPVSPDLEELLMRCLAKDPASRPVNARELDEALGRCISAGNWTRDLTEEWWRKFAGSASDKTVVTPFPEIKTG